MSISRLFLILLIAAPAFADGPRDVAARLYTWSVAKDRTGLYTMAPDLDKLTEDHHIEFTPRFYQELTDAQQSYAAYKAHQRPDYLNFDPFTYTYHDQHMQQPQVGQATIRGNKAWVPVTLRMQDGSLHRLSVDLVQKDDEWRIGNLRFLSPRHLDALTYLHRFLVSKT